MAQKGIREYDAKKLLAGALDAYDGHVVLVGPGERLEDKVAEAPWLSEKPLVVKPDQLFGKRGKHGLLGVKLDLDQAATWIRERAGKVVTVGEISDRLEYFLVEPYVVHDKECYVAFRTELESDVLYLSTSGGIDIEENWDTVRTIEIPEGSVLDTRNLESVVKEMFPEENSRVLVDSIWRLYDLFVSGHFTYLEINPVTVIDGRFVPLDTVAKVDDTAAFECRHLWGALDFPAPFGHTPSPEEAFIEEMDAKTGASLKLTVLKPQARIWTMVAGGGASVIFADTISDLGFGNELANYGEYSGNPSTEATYYYAKTIIDLMTRAPNPGGKDKLLFIGGGIANFTDIAKTFTGIIQAIEELADRMKETGVQVYVRRGGPNYKPGLEKMKALGEKLGIPIHVYGPETHMTNIVSMALA